MKKLIKKIKKLFGLNRTAAAAEAKPQEMSDLHIRPDVFAFLTCPEPLPSDSNFKDRNK